MDYVKRRWRHATIRVPTVDDSMNRREWLAYDARPDKAEIGGDHKTA